MSFTAPIGSPAERETGIIWPAKWEDKTPFDRLYQLGRTKVYHTGADLNLNFPHYNSDQHKEIYAIGDGTVTYAQRFPNPEAWGKLVIIDHGMVDGRPLFSRYAHVEAINVSLGQPVRTGDEIAKVGNGDGLFSYHLHFDISITEIFRTRPGHWPGRDRTSLRANYVNPQKWLQEHATSTGVIAPIIVSPAQNWYVSASLGLRVRQDHSTSAVQVGSLLYGSRVAIEDEERVDQDSYTWGRIRGGRYDGDWLVMGKSDQSEMYLSSSPPDR
jgi:hypothetical protein